MNYDTYFFWVLGFLIGHWFGNVFLTLRDLKAKLHAQQVEIDALKTTLLHIESPK